MEQDKISILLEEYRVRTADISNENLRYHRQTNFTHIYFSVIIGVVGVLSSNDNLRYFLYRLNLPVRSLELFYLILLSLAAMIGFYLFASTIDALRSLYLHSIRRGVIENLLNAQVGQKLLTWDSDIIFAHLFSHRAVRRQGSIFYWVKPNILVAFWVFIFFITTNLMLCFLCSFIARRYLPVYSLVVGACTLFSISQWFALHYIGFSYMQQEVDLKS